MLDDDESVKTIAIVGVALGASFLDLPHVHRVMGVLSSLVLLGIVARWAVALLQMRILHMPPASDEGWIVASSDDLHAAAFIGTGGIVLVNGTWLVTEEGIILDDGEIALDGLTAAYVYGRLMAARASKIRRRRREAEQEKQRTERREGSGRWDR